MVSESVATSSRTEASASNDVFHRLVRTISGRSVANPAFQVVEQQQLELERTQSRTSSNKLKLGIGNKLWRISQDLPLKFKSRLASPRVTTEDPSATAENVPVHGRMLSTVAEQQQPENLDALGLPSPPPTEASTPSPTTLAQRLRDLIDPLPFPTFSSPIKHPKLAPRDKDGRPIAPPGASSPVVIHDKRLLELLTSATFMNGARRPGGNNDKEPKTRPHTSIWEILESLGSPPHGFPEPLSVSDGDPPTSPDQQQPSTPPPADDEGNGGGEPRYAGTSSVMLYSPLIPGREDIVELGELLPISVIEEELAQAASFGGALKGWTSVWPLSLITGWTQLNNQVGTMEASSLFGEFSKDFYVYSDVTSTDALGRMVRLKSTSAWVPSTTKLSFQVMWWGYRLWLPPPVMDILSDHSLEAAKRASLIATALAWFFNNLPVNMFPVQVRPVLLLMQRIVPYLGYIATFISWSWGTIKGYDLGHGVTLTATWLLPIALIPGTWFDRDVPKSPTQSPPANLPNSPTMPTTPTPTSPPTSTPTTPSQPPLQTPKTPTTSPLPPTAPSQPNPAHPPIEAPPATQPVLQPTPAIPSPPAEPPVTVLVVPSPSPPTTPGTGPNDPTIPPIPSPILPPVPPILIPRTPVKVGSELGEVLLHAPVLRPVPLPEESSAGENLNLNVVLPRSKEKKRMKRMKAFFGKVDS